jgi:hypothetical protein
VDAKIAAVKKSSIDLVSRMVGSPVIPSVRAPKIPVPLAQNRISTAINWFIKSSASTPALFWPGKMRSMGVRSCVPARSIHFSIFNRPPIIVPMITASAMGGRLMSLLRKNTPILIEIKPEISGSVFLK